MVNYPRQNISFSLRKQSYVYNHILVKIRKLKVCNLIQKVRVRKNHCSNTHKSEHCGNHFMVAHLAKHY